MKLYRVCRGILAGVALTTGIAFGLRHLLVWRMVCQYRLENETAKKGTP